MLAAAPSRKWIRSLLAVVLVAVVSLGLPAAAGAQTAAQISRIKDLDRQALADYKAEDHESARIGLREAIALANRAGLLNDPLMARLWLHLAAVLINGVGDAEKGAKAAAVAVRIDPGIQVPASLSTPALKEALDKARAGGGKPRGPGRGGAAPAPAVTPPTPPAAPATPPPAAATPPAAEPKAEPAAEAAPAPGPAQAPEATGQLRRAGPARDHSPAAVLPDRRRGPAQARRSSFTACCRRR